jgi:hypothetical protein
MSTTLTLKIGGQDRILAFEEMGFLENVGEICGKDPLEFLSLTRTSTRENFEYIETITHAALLTQCAIEDREPDFDKGKVRRWVKAMSFPDGAKVLESFTRAMTHLLGGSERKTEPGEQTAQATQQTDLAGNS